MKCSRVSEDSHISLRIVAQLRHCPFSQPSLPLFFPLRPPLPRSIPIHPPRFPPLHLSSPQLPLLAAMRSPWHPLSPPALLLSIRPTSTPLLRPSRPAAPPPHLPPCPYHRSATLLSHYPKTLSRPSAEQKGRNTFCGCAR